MGLSPGDPGLQLSPEGLPHIPDLLLGKLRQQAMQPLSDPTIPCTDPHRCFTSATRTHVVPEPPPSPQDNWSPPTSGRCCWTPGATAQGRDRVLH